MFAKHVMLIALENIIERLEHMGQELDNLTAAVAANTALIQQAVAALTGSAGGAATAAQLTALTNAMTSADGTLSAALATVAANPANPPGVPPIPPGTKAALVAASLPTPNQTALTALTNTLASVTTGPTVALRAAIIAAGVDPVQLAAIVATLPATA